MPGMDGPVAELDAEQRDLDALLARLDPAQWRAPTPAVPWDVRDQVSHLADTNDICIDTIAGGPRSLNTEATKHASPEAFTDSGCEKGRAMQPGAVLRWWRESSARQSQALRAKDPAERVPWGLGMSARMMATARLMEHWAHGLDVRAAVGEPPNATPRLRSIAFLIVRALPYAFGVAKVEPPPGTLRAELTYDGDVWRIGPDDADNVIAGDSLEFCRVGVQRMRRADATTLKAIGPLAEAALTHARAFL